jgi:hypothetical protein
MKPSGKHTKNYGKSPFSMGKSTISMAMFNSYVTNFQRVTWNKRIDGQIKKEHHCLDSIY